MHAPKTRPPSHRRGRGHTGGAQVAHHWVLPTTLARVHLEECVEIFNVNTDEGRVAAGAGVGVGRLARMPARAHDVRTASGRRPPCGVGRPGGLMRKE